MRFINTVQLREPINGARGWFSSTEWLNLNANDVFVKPVVKISVSLEAEFK
jgi:hypothetical protein